jgi:UDPglucose 6-dehydrogenase
VNVTVVGCGYVGLVTAVGLAFLDHSVVGVDVLPSRVGAINQGEAPFHEPGLSEYLARALARGSFRATADLDSAVGRADVILICVETPASGDGSINLGSVELALGQVGRAMARCHHYQVVVIRSTVIPGTTAGLALSVLKRTTAGRTEPHGLAVNPEFLREGEALADFLHPDRIVVGASDSRACEAVVQLYEPLDAPIIRTNPSTAEMIKYASNSLLATLISFSNEIAAICERLEDTDVETVFAAVHADRRLRPLTGSGVIRPGILAYLWPGCGYGGSCLPKDVRALIAASRDLGHRPRLLEAVDGINSGQAAHLVDLAQEALGGLAGRKVTVLGLAFKGSTDDLRESPGVAVVEELLRRGSQVTTFDPLVAGQALATRGVRCAVTIGDALRDADACLVTANAPEFRDLHLFLSSESDRQPLVVDGRRILARHRFPEGRYVGVGWRGRAG